jgi:hypothetical protein
MFFVAAVVAFGVYYSWVYIALGIVFLIVAGMSASRVLSD